MNPIQFRHAYHQKLTYKIMMAKKPGVVLVTFEQALAMIRQLYWASAGIPQIVYLCGWQYDGHDSKYPAWGEMNERLKRPQDKNAHESLLWIVEEARTYNATVSVHINMCDAYKNSPLWNEYERHDLLIRDSKGELIPGGIWGGEQSYLISKTREWESGHARKRIDALLDFLPIAEAGTVHIDVFSPRHLKLHKEFVFDARVTLEQDVEAIKQIILYWDSHGIDVTKEWFEHEFAGYIPMAYHFGLDEASRLKYAPSVVCGGGAAWNRRKGGNLDPLWGRPEHGCLYEEAWGTSVLGDLKGCPEVDQNWLNQVYSRTLPWTFLNRHRALEHTFDEKAYSVRFQDDVETSVVLPEERLFIRHKGELLAEGTDFCIPAPWAGESAIAWSKNGCDREWKLPLQNSVSKVELFELSRKGQVSLGIRTCADGRMNLQLQPEKAVLIRAL